MSKPGPVIVWFRQDLRVWDNPALAAAALGDRPVLPVYVHAPDEEGGWPAGGAARVWLHQSLEALDGALAKRGARLVIVEGPTLDRLERLVRSVRAAGVYWNRRYEPAAIERDTQVKRALRQSFGDAEFEAKSFKGAVLVEPHEVSTKAGKPFQVFTPYWRHVQTLGPPAEPLAPPAHLTMAARAPKGLRLGALALKPRLDWSAGIESAWRFGERGARDELEIFLDSGLARYGDRRDIPGVDGVSRLSPHLHFGELSPRQVWHAAARSAGASATRRARAEPFLRQLAWRDFAHSLLFHFPHTTTGPLHAKYARFPWRTPGRELEAWQRGRTGYPLVDAGMRQLYRTGWMHNRVRMVVASFLVKHLLVHWVEGARWFWDTLVDADLANNTMGWQWAAGCGADAAPYFRIFNPVSQGERFDADGRYVKAFVPELARLEPKWIHKPWQAPAAVLRAAGVVLGESYPHPVVEHGAARQRALDALATLKAV